MGAPYFNYLYEAQELSLAKSLDDMSDKLKDLDIRYKEKLEEASADVKELQQKLREAESRPK